MPSISNIMIERQTAPTTPLDYSSNASFILAINGFLVGLSLLIFGARIYVRSMMLKTVGADDYVMVAAMLCGVGVFVCFIGETHHGLGMHQDTITLPEVGKLLHWQFFHTLIVTTGISFIKISIGCFFLRFVTNNARYFVIGMIAFLIAFIITCAGTLIFACIPIRAAWDMALAPTSKCFSGATFTHIGFFNSATNIATDFIFAIFPIPIIWNLRVNNRTRASLLVILSLGFCACACSIVKFIIQIGNYHIHDFTFHDTLWVWNSVELNIGIIAACLPILRPIFAVILNTTRASKTGSAGPGSNGQNRVIHVYTTQDESGPGMGNGEFWELSRVRTTTVSSSKEHITDADIEYCINEQ